MALMLDTWLRRKKIRDRVDITWSTYEESYIQAFGPRMHDLVTREFEQRGITGHTLYAADNVEQGMVAYKNGDGLPFDLLVSFPPYAASSHFTHLPVDDRGFIATDLKSRRVVGYPDIFAVGDASDFPMKQAFLAFLQADAAADHLSAEILGGQPVMAFDPVTVSVMEQFDSATFAQVPLRLTGDAENPLEVRTDADASDLYRVGSSPIWRLGKMALGLYLPWRFKAGNPLHSGVPWKGMEAGMRLVSGLTTR
jgi:sulfide:quinone oxidoreductase